MLSIPSGSITYVVEKLEKKELIKRETDPATRVSNVVLSEKGKRLFDEIFPRHVETISHVLAFISTDEKELLIRLLKKIGLGAKELGGINHDDRRSQPGIFVRTQVE